MLGAIVGKRSGEQYERGINDCDIWVESVLNQANIALPANWTPAATTTVGQHVNNLRSELQSQPSPGANLVFHNNNHVMIGYLNADNTFDIAHNTSNPANRVHNDGNSEVLRPYENVAKFEATWNSINRPTYYVPLEQAAPPANPAQSASGSQALSNGRQNPSGGKGH
jgi:hypothetical protein